MAKMKDRHRFYIDISDGYCSLHVECPYAMGDESRPCWPYDVETDEPTRLAAPQNLCIYESWVENESIEDIVHGALMLRIAGWHVEWNGGNFEVHI